MKDKIASAAQNLACAAKARPEESKWSLIGAAVGAILGLIIGGIGVTAMGGAIGVPATVVLAVVGGVLGNRYGISKDRPVR
ncbi:hypothetical protein EHS39_13470 [Ensifer sp. MPMI2T]|nr:hypothetical protein EHS39_13470 [Ensifer sp. MPMI2T]